jgi:peroxiredoxin
LLGGLFGLALLVGQAALLLQVLRQQGRILLRLDALDPRANGGGVAAQPPAAIAGLPIGSPAPGFRLDGLDGESTTLEDLLANAKPVLLLFTNPNCGPCQALLPEVGRWQGEHGATLSIALVSEGTAADNRTKTAKQGVSPVLLQRKREVAEIYQSWGTPGAVVIRPDGTIGSPSAQGADAIRALVAQIVSDAPALRMAAEPTAATNGQNGNGYHSPLASAAKLGDPAPPLKLRDLNGKRTALTAFRGCQTLVLFWNPRCGFCQQMLSDLRDWDADPPPAAPALVVISTGTAEEGREMALRSPVLLDSSQKAGAAFGANGTPMAVLLDAGGRIASEIAAGVQAVFALAESGATAPTGSVAAKNYSKDIPNRLLE